MDVSGRTRPRKMATANGVAKIAWRIKNMTPSKSSNLLREYINTRDLQYELKKYLAEEGFDYELRDVPVKDIKPNQTGEDYINASSIETAQRIKEAKNINELPRTADIRPILLDDKMNIIDGNHRHYASILNGEKTIPSLVPVKKGSGKIINLQEYGIGILTEK
jgi:hypothetical protein